MQEPIQRVIVFFESIIFRLAKFRYNGKFTLKAFLYGNFFNRCYFGNYVI